MNFQYNTVGRSSYWSDYLNCSCILIYWLRVAALYTVKYVCEYILYVSEPWRLVGNSLLCNNGLHFNWHVTLVKKKDAVVTIHWGIETGFFPPSATNVPYGFRGHPSRLWPKCNWLLRLGRPWGAVTLSRWGGWWYINVNYQEGP
jgi:hypothetical protein